MANYGLSNAGLYNGGAVRLDSTPHTQLLVNLLGRQQAKQEALDEYYRKLPQTITTTGMNYNDVPAFNKAINDWQSHYLQNKNAILNPRMDNGRAAIENQQLLRVAQSIPQQSIMEQKKIQPLNNSLSDPDKRNRITPQLLSDMDAHNRALYVQDENGNLIPNPTRKSIDLTKLDFNAKPLDLAAHDKIFANIPQSEGNIKVSTDKNNPLTQVISKEKGYITPEQKHAIAQTSIGAYNQDPSFHQFINDKIKNITPDEYNSLNATWKSVMGKNLDIQHPEEFAAAWDISRKSPVQTTLKTQTDPFARANYQNQLTLGREKTMAGINHGFQSWMKQHVPTWKESQETKDDGTNAGALFREVSSNVNIPKATIPGVISGVVPISGGKVLVSDPTILQKYGAKRIEYEPKTNKMNLIIPDKTNPNNEQSVSYDPKTYLTDKAKILYGTNKNAANLSNIVTKYYDENGGNLLKIIQAFNSSEGQKPTTNQTPSTKTTPQATGKKIVLPH